MILSKEHYHTFLCQDKGNTVDFIHVHISKTFDTVSHWKLLTRLETTGVMVDKEMMQREAIEV